MNNTNRIDNLLMNKWTYILLSIFFLGISTYIFKWQHFCYWFNDNYVVDNTLFGTFGDFIGGVLGTIFSMISILILIRTFNQQRQVTEESKKLADTQRFNDLFFEILRIYQEQIKNIQNNVGKTESLKNEDFFDFNKQKIQKQFPAIISIESNQKKALHMYMDFYLVHKSKLGICYRTLFRIYELIDNAKILDENSKKNYLKIVRAQLTESELFFLRYNAMCFYGSGFIKYLNKYNVLKHLPVFELLEFKYWKEKTIPIESVGLNILFHYLEKQIYQKLHKENSIKKSTIQLPDSKKYAFKIIIDKNRSSLTIFCFISDGKTNTCKEYAGFDKFDMEPLQELFDCFLKEIFIHKTFTKVNTSKSLKFSSKTTSRKNNIICVMSNVKTVDGSKLRIRPILSNN